VLDTVVQTLGQAAPAEEAKHMLAWMLSAPVRMMDGTVMPLTTVALVYKQRAAVG
jgi:hypothetical protein